MEDQARMLPEKVALITGGGLGGMGAAMALRFAREAAGIVVGDIDADLARQTADAVIAAGGQACWVQFDIREDADCQRLVAAALARFGAIDILVNAAGRFPFEHYGEVRRADFIDVLDVNVAGMLAMTQFVGEHMIARGKGGAVLNIASIAGRTAQPLGPAYAASKAAVISLTRSCAAALAPHRIRVNGLAPGFTSTKMWAAIEAYVTAQGADLSTFRESMLSTVPLSRMGTPTDMAEAALFLVSDASGFVIGQTLNIDGGLVPG